MTTAAPAAGFAQVALPLPLHTTYTYAVPEALAARAVAGARVRVRVRNRVVTGLVTAVTAASEVEALPVLEAPDEAPLLDAPLRELAEWIAGYYGAPIGLVLRSMLPAALWEPDRETTADERILRLAGDPLSLLDREARFKRAARQRALYEALEALGGAAPAAHLREQLGFSDALMRSLVKAGLATAERAARHRDPFAAIAGTAPPTTLTDAQTEALARIEALAPGDALLLYGVTGSGKTLVYLEAIRRALHRDEGAIVLVPEIALTPQTVARLRGVFGDQVAVLHSGLSDGERADAWRALRRGERRVAVGARSAIFAPIPRLGLIAVDEEHEATYKNGETPRYHARDVAMARARLEGARLVLGSATPSLETASLVGTRVQEVRLPARVGDRPMPPVELVDLRKTALVRELAPLPWSTALDEALARTLARGEQAILLLNRRGFAAFLQCPDCGAVRDCPNCSISLTVHRAPPGLRCHYCDHQEPYDTACTACGAAQTTMKGIGTQQLEQAMAERFPAARLARMDLDTTSTKWGHQRILERVAAREVDVLIGTQMIAKGLDFPDVTLVGVVDADTGLHLPDFRAAERAFQLLAQVAGRAGRGVKGGRVLVQTRTPDHHALRCAAAHDVDGFLAEEGAMRRSPPYPPAVSLLNLLVSGEDEAAVTAGAAVVADWCAALTDRHGLPLTILGPAPAPLVRLKERWRWHVVLKGPAADIGRVVRYAARRLKAPPNTRLTLDRDPVSLL
jgi:primosomal protein N' (replication factor Y)